MEIVLKIDLGQHLTHRGKTVTAWIEPDYPASRHGVIRDSGVLCIREQNADADNAPILRLGSTPENHWALQANVGGELADRLISEQREYGKRPYCMLYDHCVLGKLYFEPHMDTDSKQLVGISFSTRPDRRFVSEGAVIPLNCGPEQLQALFVHEQLERSGKGCPDSEQLAVAVDHAAHLSHSAISAASEYWAEVDWEFDQRLWHAILSATGREPLTDSEEIEKYESLAYFAERPDVDVSNGDTPQYFLWNEYGGKRRLEPLTSEEMSSFMVTYYGPDGSFPDADDIAIQRHEWDWFKDKRLGKLRYPVETLQTLISQAEAENTGPEWFTKARRAADFCHLRPMNPATIYGTLNDYIVHCEEQATPPNTASKNEHYRLAREAVSYMELPEHGLLIDPKSPLIAFASRHAVAVDRQTAETIIQLANKIDVSNAASQNKGTRELVISKDFATQSTPDYDSPAP